jgi:hypothetical protein
VCNWRNGPIGSPPRIPIVKMSKPAGAVIGADIDPKRL